MSQNSPLQSFFRKPKLQLKLPSNGRWYAPGELSLSQNSQVDVFSMTASDDVKFKASETSFSGTNTFELIKSCVPSIRNPERMPSVDLDIVLLAIRKASYGDELNLKVNVPNTSLQRKLTVSIEDLINQAANNTMEWEDELEITNGSTNEVLLVKVKPNIAKTLFDLTKTVNKQNQLTLKAAESADDDKRMDVLDDSVKQLSNVKVDVVIDTIYEIVLDTFKTNKKEEIANLIKNLDYSYFKAIEKHVEKQRQKYTLEKVTCISTSEELSAGAPATWDAEITFIDSDFFRADE